MAKRQAAADLCLPVPMAAAAEGLSGTATDNGHATATVRHALDNAAVNGSSGPAPEWATEGALRAATEAALALAFRRIKTAVRSAVGAAVAVTVEDATAEVEAACKGA